MRQTCLITVYSNAGMPAVHYQDGYLIRRVLVMTNVIHAETAAGKPDAADIIMLHDSVAADYADYVTDESRMQGTMTGIAFPRSEEEVAAVCAYCMKHSLPVTVSGARTGITGGAVPEGSVVISFEKMDRITGMARSSTTGEFIIRCQPGVIIDELKNYVASASFPGSDTWDPASSRALEEFRESPAQIYPPDPTELSATLGGTVACNASGARSFTYGPTRNYIESLRAVLADGSVIQLERGTHKASADGSFILAMPDGSERKGTIPSYAMPQGKNAAGYYATPHMDLVDLFIGAEGTLAVFTEISIRIIQSPGDTLGILAFFPRQANAVEFVRRCRGEIDGGDAAGPRPLALEYFDSRSLALLKKQKQETGPDSPIPALPPDAEYAVYAEWAYTPSTFDEIAMSALELLETCGSREDTAWTATEKHEVQRIKAFRHALPEAVNQLIGQRRKKEPGLTKLGTDMAVPDEHLETMLDYYNSELKKACLDYVIFGHIGDNHLHVNILPRTMDEYQRGKEVYSRFAEKAVELGGTVSAEHGIGKLKTPFLKILYKEDAIDEMRSVKQVFDPAGLLNRGNVFVV